VHQIAAKTSYKIPEVSGGRIRTDLLVIGGGSGGLSVAAGAIQMGASVVLVEKGRMGGDCLNTGCVPSKALIAAAKVAQSFRRAEPFGIGAREPEVDFGKVHGHVHDVISAIAPHDSVERFEGLGVKVISGAARFVSRDTVEADGLHITARRIVVATGSKASVPPIPGIRDAGFMTNENLFDMKSLPRKLIVIGGGPIGIEMAQAFRRLGSEVAVLERFSILPRDEPEAAELIREVFCEAGIEVRENVSISRVERRPDGVSVLLEDSGQPQVSGTHILVAAGREAVTNGLNLEAAGIEFDHKGIKVDAGLRTSNKRVFAIGDVASGPQFTHVAGYHAGVVIRRALFGLPAKVNYSALPWVTYTDPELAHTGMTEKAALDAGHAVQILHARLNENDRARAERETKGFAKIVLGKRGRILGATIAAPSAGEMIGMWTLAIAQKAKIGTIASMTAAYPTLSELSKRAAGSYYTPSLFSPRTRRIVGFLQRIIP
jgi:pyruvate/2-oxoglutarate dehydrogenase complex dihydrolipoamide dehydrogenase (E3) component